MKPKTVINILVISLVFIGLFVWGYYAQKKGTTASVQGVVDSLSSSSQLTVPETFYDFGTISMKNGDVNKMFKVINSGSEDVRLPSLTTSCMCTKAYFIEPNGNKKGPFGMPGMGFVPKLNAVIKAGQSADIEVVYDPNAHGPAGVGMIDRFVYLTGASKNTLQFEIKALVTP